MSQTSPLFRKLIDGFTFGELPKGYEPKRKEQPNELTPAQRRAAGFVQLENDEWVHHTQAVLLPKKGKMHWVRLQGADSIG